VLLDYTFQLIEAIDILAL